MNYGFDLPEGSQMLGVHAPEDNTWETIKKEGLKSFSIEAYLNSVEAEHFRMVNYCLLTYKDVIKAKLKKTFFESHVSQLNQFSNAQELILEEFSSDCQCKNCNELKSLKWNLPGVLPEGKKNYKKITN